MPSAFQNGNSLHLNGKSPKSISRTRTRLGLHNSGADIRTITSIAPLGCKVIQARPILQSEVLE